MSYLSPFSFITLLLMVRMRPILGFYPWHLAVSPTLSTERTMSVSSCLPCCGHRTGILNWQTEPSQRRNAMRALCEESISIVFKRICTNQTRKGNCELVGKLHVHKYSTKHFRCKHSVYSTNKLAPNLTDLICFNAETSCPSGHDLVSRVAPLGLGSRRKAGDQGTHPYFHRHSP